MKMDLEKLGKIMDIFMDNCSECPLEIVCNSSYENSCENVWEKFFKEKVKEDGVE